VTALEAVRSRAEALMTEHLGAGSWAFGFDNAKTRAGQCDFARKRITVSRHLATRFSEEDIEQVLLHGPKWKRTAASIGYTGSRLHDGPIASELAPWIGTCPAGHEHFRYRTPTRQLACARCARRFDSRNLIVWRRRTDADDPAQVAATTA